MLAHFPRPSDLDLRRSAEREGLSLKVNSKRSLAYMSAPYLMCLTIRLVHFFLLCSLAPPGPVFIILAIIQVPDLAEGRR